jgi:hypothetical protein
MRGEGRFKVTTKSREYSTFFTRKQNVSESDPRILEFVANVHKYRLFSVDTENKEHPIMLQLGDLEGNVLVFGDARQIPASLKALIEDVRYPMVQSAIVEDLEMLEKADITAKGWLDSQVVMALIEPENPKKGTDGQSQMLKIDVRKFDWREMRDLKTALRPCEHSMLHAIHDVRVPLLTTFKAAEKNATRLNPQLVPNNDVFPYLWAVVNRCLSVPMKVADHGVPELSSEEIIQSQWDFCERPRKYPKRPHAEKKASRTDAGRKHENAKHRSKQKLRNKLKKAATTANIEN